MASKTIRSTKIDNKANYEALVQIFKKYKEDSPHADAFNLMLVCTGRRQAAFVQPYEDGHLDTTEHNKKRNDEIIQIVSVYPNVKAKDNNGDLFVIDTKQLAYDQFRIWLKKDEIGQILGFLDPEVDDRAAFVAFDVLIERHQYESIYIQSCLYLNADRLVYFNQLLKSYKTLARELNVEIALRIF
jgi:hypothetical protein